MKIKSDVLSNLDYNKPRERASLPDIYTDLPTQLTAAKEAFEALTRASMELDYIIAHYTNLLQARAKTAEMEVGSLQAFVNAQIQTTTGRSVDATHLRDEITQLDREIKNLLLTDSKTQAELTKADADNALGISRAFAKRIINDFGPAVLLQLLLKWREYLKSFLSKPERIHAKTQFLTLIEGVIKASSSYYSAAIQASTPIGLLTQGELKPSSSETEEKPPSNLTSPPSSEADRYGDIINFMCTSFSTISPALTNYPQNPPTKYNLLNIIPKKPTTTAAPTIKKDEVLYMLGQLGILEVKTESLQKEVARKQRIAQQLYYENDLIIAALDEKTNGAYSKMGGIQTEVRGVSTSEAQEFKKQVAKRRFERDVLQHKIAETNAQNIVLNRAFIAQVTRILTPQDGEALKAGWLREVLAFFHVDSNGKIDGGKLYQELNR